MITKAFFTAIALLLNHSLMAEEANPEITFLLNHIEHSECLFIRNGVEHDAADATDHLRLKLKRGGRYVNSAEQFIDRLASESSWTGKPYFIRCEKEKSPSQDWLKAALEHHRSSR